MMATSQSLSRLVADLLHGSRAAYWMKKGKCRLQSILGLHLRVESVGERTTLQGTAGSNNQRPSMRMVSLLSRWTSPPDWRNFYPSRELKSKRLQGRAATFASLRPRLFADSHIGILRLPPTQMMSQQLASVFARTWLLRPDRLNFLSWSLCTMRTPSSFVEHFMVSWRI